jgi:hypothetical protein
MAIGKTHGEKAMTKEVSQLARQLMGNAGVKFFTQQEFDTELMLAKAEIMTVAIETSRRAVLLERQACAEVCKRFAEQEDEGETSTALMNAAMAIMNRIPSQRQ